MTNAKETDIRFMNLCARIYVAGHSGLVGSAIREKLHAQGYRNFICHTHAELDLLDPIAVNRFFTAEKPEFVFLAAARAGGIMANQMYPATFIRDNLVIETNIIEAARLTGVRRLLFVGSSCIYPKMAVQPMPESCLLEGPLEPTNRPYAIAKIAGIELCWSYNRQYDCSYLAVMPPNLYGPGDNFDIETSHALPALIHRTAEAKRRGDRQLVVWGSGTPKREFMHSSDLAEACLFLMNLDQAQFASLIPAGAPPLINIGTGEEVTIRALAEIISKTMGFAGELVFDSTKPDGTPRKLLDVRRIHGLGWHHRIQLEEGIRQTCHSFLKTYESLYPGEHRVSMGTVRSIQ